MGALGDIQAVAMTIYGEARGQSLLDRLAVGAVIRERYMRPGWWTREHGDGIPDDTWEAACRDPWQFSCWSAHDASHQRNYKRMMAAPTADAQTFAACLLVAQYVVEHMSDKDVQAMFDVPGPDRFPTHYFSAPLTAPPASWGSTIIEVTPRFRSAFRFFIVFDGRPKRRP